MFMVVLMSLWPSHSWISFGLTPFFSSREAQLWRRLTLLTVSREAQQLPVDNMALCGYNEDN